MWYGGSGDGNRKRQRYRGYHVESISISTKPCENSHPHPHTHMHNMEYRAHRPHRCKGIRAISRWPNKSRVRHNNMVPNICHVVLMPQRRDIDGVCIMCGKWTNGWQSGFSSIWTAFTWDIEKNSWFVISRTMKFCSAVHHTKPNMWDEHDCEKHIKEQNTQKIIYKSSSSFYYLGFQVDSHQIIWFYWCWSLYCSNARTHTHSKWMMSCNNGQQRVKRILAAIKECTN